MNEVSDEAWNYAFENRCVSSHDIFVVDQSGSVKLIHDFNKKNVSVKIILKGVGMVRRLRTFLVLALKS